MSWLVNKWAIEKLTLVVASFYFLFLWRNSVVTRYCCKFSNFSDCCCPVSWEYCDKVKCENADLYCILLAQLLYHYIINTGLPSNLITIHTSLCLKSVTFIVQFPFIPFVFTWQIYILVKKQKILWNSNINSTQNLSSYNCTPTTCSVPSSSAKWCHIQSLSN